MASIGRSDVVTASVNSEKTRMKKLMMMKMIIGERAKRARHSQVCSIENHYWRARHSHVFSIENRGYIIGERAKRARHSLVCSIENRGYIYYYYV